MNALDTNVLVRFLVNDDTRQARIVYKLFKLAESNKESYWVPLLVVLETIWVLDSVYEIPREEILDSLNDLLMMTVLKFESPSTIQKFIHSARKNTLDLSDVLIASAAGVSGCESILTFDKKASRHDLFKLIQADGT